MRHSGHSRPSATGRLRSVALLALLLIAAGAILGYVGYLKVQTLGPPQRTIDAGKAAVTAVRPGHPTV